MPQKSERNEFIKEILDTFDLKDERKRKLYSYLSTRMDYFPTNTDLYRYITNLLLEKSAPTTILRLDKPIKDNSGDLFHEIIGAPDTNLESILNEPNNNGLTISEILFILKNKLDYSDFLTLKKLASQNNDTRLNTNYLYIINNLPQIRSRIKVFSKNNQNILIPRRPIIKIDLTDKNFRVIFGKRDYNKNPLDYFLDNYSNQNLTRTDLSKQDKGLSNALYRYNQMNLAIPFTIHRNFNGNPLNFFREKYKDKKISRSKLQQKDDGLYRALLDKGDLDKAIPEKKPNSSRWYINQKHTKKILELYYKFNGNASQASKNSQYSWDTLTRYWGDLDLKMTNHRIKSNKELNKIIELYEIYGGSARRASANSHHSRSTIIKYWKKAGLEVRDSGQHNKQGVILKTRLMMGVTTF